MRNNKIVCECSKYKELEKMANVMEMGMFERLHDCEMRRQDIICNGLDTIGDISDDGKHRKVFSSDWGTYSRLLFEYEKLGEEIKEIKERFKNLGTDFVKRNIKIKDNLTLWKMSKGLKLSEWDKTDGVEYLEIDEQIKEYEKKQNNRS
tara:strand:- start:705 stop:1151 length:447 start_codon:yes stop_codon:yes gene_type:complete